MPQANSTTSSPRRISPLASETTLPCSLVINAASLSTSCSTSSRNRNRMRARTCGGVAAQLRNARSAQFTASLTSAASASATSAVCSPVAGSNTCAHGSPARPFSSPSMKWGMSLVAVIIRLSPRRCAYRLRARYAERSCRSASLISVLRKGGISAIPRRT